MLSVCLWANIKAAAAAGLIFHAAKKAESSPEVCPLWAEREVRSSFDVCFRVWFDSLVNARRLEWRGNQNVSKFESLCPSVLQAGPLDDLADGHLPVALSRIYRPAHQNFITSRPPHCVIYTQYKTHAVTASCFQRRFLAWWNLDAQGQSFNVTQQQRIKGVLCSNPFFLVWSVN